MRDTGNKGKDKVEESNKFNLDIYGAMGKCTLEIGNMIVCTDKDNCFYKMDKSRFKNFIKIT